MIVFINSFISDCVLGNIDRKLMLVKRDYLLEIFDNHLKVADNILMSQ